MIRLATTIIISLLIAAAIAWLLSLPGTVAVELAGYRMQPRLGVAAFLLLGTVGVLVLIWAVLRRILAAPRFLARRAAERRREQGVVALSDGFIALQAGDSARARVLAREARTNLPYNPAAQLLEARAELALGDMASAREHYRALISNPKTAVAALAGLYEQSRTQDRADTALTFARKAAQLAPDAAWARTAVFDDLTRRAKWSEALVMVNAEPAGTRAEKLEKRRRQAVLETAMAREVETTEPMVALDHALAALRLVPDFVPAALIAARVHSDRGEGRRAMSLLRRVWRASGHPDVAALYAGAISGTTAVERYRRMRDLVESPPPTREAACALARAAIDAFEWSGARNALASYSVAQPTQLVCVLMAEIEEGQNGDQGKAREWLARAVRAPRDPVWVADGVVSEEWQPVSSATGKLDAFVWKAPASEPAQPALNASQEAQGPSQGAPLALPGS